MLVNLENHDLDKKYLSKNNVVNLKKKIIYLALLCIIIIISFYFAFLTTKLLKNSEIIINQNNDLINKLKNLVKKQNYNYGKYTSFSFSNNTLNDVQTEEFNDNLEKKYIENQHHFCKSNDLFVDKVIDNKLEKVRAYLNNISFNMLIYNSTDFVSNSIKESGSWDKTSTNNLISCLNYYSQKKKLSKNEITILDIGANVGWYSLYLAKAGYELYSFEISRINTYILKKNFCLNENLKVTIINKGISIDKGDEKCILHHPSHNIGNAVILCGENTNIPLNNEKNINEVVQFTKLSNYYNFLSKKNIALIKIDVEGYEGSVIKSGIEFISKYHVPFLFIEFTKDYLKMQGTEPKELLEIFKLNGYLISTTNFFSKSYLSIKKILKLKATNLYLVYSKFIDKN